MRKRALKSYILGVLTGAVLFGGTAAFAAGIAAEKSKQPFFVNGSPVEVDAYLIEGNNYLKLRDIARLADFGVSWNELSRTVSIDTSLGYYDLNAEEKAESPASGEEEAEASPSLAQASEIDYSAEANSKVFQGAYTREIYNAVREAMETGEGKTAGAVTEDGKQAAMEVIGASFDAVTCDVRWNADRTLSLSKRVPEAYIETIEKVSPFIKSLEALSEEEKLNRIADYVCERLDYQSSVTPTPNNIFNDSSVKYGNCMAFAHAFKFLCDLADIPCVFLHSDTHQWNAVYAGGNWQQVDITAYDLLYNSGYERRSVIGDQESFTGSDYDEIDTEISAFAKELLLHGSTK